MKSLFVFIDESGNTGEINIDEKSINHFFNQPFFTLAGLGFTVEKEEEIIKEVTHLKKEHGIKSDELKASKLLRKRVSFIADVFQLLFKNQIPLFIEITDKKYYILMQIVDNVILTKDLIPSEMGLIRDLAFVKRTMADYLSQNISDTPLILFSKCCFRPDVDLFQSFLNVLKEEITRINDETSESIMRHLNKTCDDFQELRLKDEKEALYYYLPIPDKGFTKDIFLLPHVNSFSNLCARAEQYRCDQGLSRLTLIHDGQKEFSDIIKNTLNNMKEISNIDFIKKVDSIIPQSKFNIDPDIELIFKSSKESLLLQLSDIVAGTINRIWIDNVLNNKIHKELLCIVDIILDLPLIHKSSGLNMVADSKKIGKFMNF